MSRQSKAGVRRTPEAAAEAATRPHILKTMERKDFGRGLVYADLHMSGRWMEEAGFEAGGYVRVDILGYGKLQVTAVDPPADAE